MPDGSAAWRGTIKEDLDVPDLASQHAMHPPPIGGGGFTGLRHAADFQEESHCWNYKDLKEFSEI